MGGGWGPHWSLMGPHVNIISQYTYTCLQYADSYSSVILSPLHYFTSVYCSYVIVLLNCYIGITFEHVSTISRSSSDSLYTVLFTQAVAPSCCVCQFVGFKMSKTRYVH